MSSNGKPSEEKNETLNRLASIGQISAGIAHEVRNPLTAVKGFLQLLKEEINHDYLNIANTELEHALATLNNLLQVSKPDLMEEDFVPISLSAELESIVTLFQDQVYRVQIIKNFTHTDTRIVGKKNLLKKAFFNLFKNAFEAIPEKGEIRIEHYVSGKYLHVNISDSGIGIPEDKIKLLGTPFFSTKDEGTGMGLTQVFTTMYEHNATIDVTSRVNKGTKFAIRFPILELENVRVKEMNNLTYIKGQNFQEFVLANREQFDEMVYQKIEPIVNQLEESDLLNKERLVESAYQIVCCIQEDAEHELIMLANESGIQWAKSDVPAILKMEWFRGFREVYWDFLYNYYNQEEVPLEIKAFFDLKKKTGYLMDTFLMHYFIKYNEFKNELIRSHREMIEELTVPIIPLSSTMAVLPIIGTMDTFRAKKIQERLLLQVSHLKIKRIIIDLSGVDYMDTAVAGHLFKIVEGINILGCQATVTGIRPEIVNTMIEMGITITHKIDTFGDLQQAIEKYGVHEKP